MQPWIQKYQPRKLRDVIGQKEAVYTLYTFYTKFKSYKQNAALLYGPPGCGKTSIAYALAKQENLELIELNASDFRNKEQIEGILKPASQQASIFGSKKIILIDEVDGLSGSKDRGGVQAMISVIKETRFPIILTANDPWDTRLRTLRNYCLLVPLNKINYMAIADYLKKICEKESITYDKTALKKLAMSVDGDLRAAINDLQAMSQSACFTDKELVIWGREQDENIFNALKLVFKSFDSKTALSAVDNLSEDLDNINLWLEQNISAEYLTLLDKYRAYAHLSYSDMFLARIHRWQHWRFLLYAKLLSILGVQQAKEKTNKNFVMHKKPELLIKLYMRAAQLRKIRGIAQQLSSKLHASARVLQRDFIPYWEFIHKKNSVMGKELDACLGI